MSRAREPPTKESGRKNTTIHDASPEPGGGGTGDARIYRVGTWQNLGNGIGTLGAQWQRKWAGEEAVTTDCSGAGAQEGCSVPAVLT